MTEAIIDTSLNAEQKRAVTHDGGPLLIVAGAGTGKTTVITRRIAWLIDQKRAAPDEILALTFTDKAAAEMEDRVDRLLPYGRLDSWISTFHSFGERILRERGIDIGIDPSFRVLSESGQWSLLKRHLDDLPLDYYRPLGNPTKFFGDLIRHFSRLKDEAISHQEYEKLAIKRTRAARDDEQRAEAARLTELAKAYGAYQQLLADEHALDYGDLIMQTLRLFRERPNVLAEFQRRFRAILVDEFQDTNVAQYELVKLLADKEKNITVVGDDDQSIYKFRGASISNILEFTKDYPDATEVVLTTNYRSRQDILDLAYDFIQQNNPNRLEAALDAKAIGEKGNTLSVAVSKKLTAERAGKAIVELRRFASEEQENSAVVAGITELKAKHEDLTWRDFAVLYRSNEMAATIHDALTRAGIPAAIVSSRGILQYPDVLDVLSYFRLLDAYHEANAAYRVLSWDVLGIPMRDVMTILQNARCQTVSVYEMMERAGSLPVAQRTKRVLERLVQHVARHTELTRRQSVGRVFYAVLDDLQLRKRYSDVQSAEDQERLDALNRFAAIILRFDRETDDASVKNFLEHIRTLTDAGDDREQLMDESDPDAVRLSTVHGAKGLEFAHVFLVKLADRRFPTIERKERIPVPDELVKDIVLPGNPHLEEERRLFYVAVTRAKDGLYLSSAADYGGKTEKKPSRFIDELGADHVKLVDSAPVDQLAFELPAAHSRPAELVHDPDSFSFSSLDAFWTCPYQYRFKRVLGIPTQPSHVLNYGTSIHGTLRSFYESIRRGEKPTLVDLKKLYERHWIGEWYPSKKVLDERYEAGWRALERYYTEYEGTFTKPLYLERSFTLNLEDVVLKGTIDRIDETSDGSIEIVDYKTGEPKTKARAKTDQLLVYALAAESILGKLPEKLTFSYIDAGSALTFAPKQKDLDAIRTKIIEAARAIRTSTFPATPGMHCTWCDYRDICEFRV